MTVLQTHGLDDGVVLRSVMMAVVGLVLGTLVAFTTMLVESLVAMFSFVLFPCTCEANNIPIKVSVLTASDPNQTALPQSLL